MTGIVIAFFCGTLAATLQLAWSWWLPPIAAAVGALRTPRLSQALVLALASACGVLWVQLEVHEYRQQRYSATDPGSAWTLTGTVEGLPRQDGNMLRFRFRVEACTDCDRPLAGRLLLLSWPDAGTSLLPGERIALRARLRPPRGLSNGSGFSFEDWAFQQQIHASGYVLAGAADGAAPFSLDRLRLEISAWLEQELDDTAGARLLPALAVGDRRALEDRHWHAFSATGTSHLMAISGLHVGLAAGLGYLLGRLLFAVLARLQRSPPARQDLESVAAAITALAYSALAGFSLPTRRALVMVLVFLLLRTLRRFPSAGATLLAALGVCLLLDPASVVTAGFWLSFGAVAALMLALRGERRGWRSALRSQAVVFIALLPVLATAQLPGSLLAPAVNLLAIPLVGLLVVPPLLLAVLLKVLGLAGPAGLLLMIPARVMDGFWYALDGMARVAPELPLQAPGPGLALAAAAGAVALCLPRGTPGRWAGVLPLLALLVPPPDLPQGRARLHVLDVGQGLAVLVETREHLLLYDTGPRSRSGWTAAEAVILPYLEGQALGVPDRVLVSHGDMDHAGGVDRLRRAWPGAPLFSSAELPGAAPCRAGQRWRWDGVEFLMHHPTPGLPYLGNESSCVLELRAGEHRFLLTGDIGEIIEGRLARTLGAVDGLLMPHHGSRHSSSSPFLEVTRPRLAIASAGAQNRFGMPHVDALERYRQVGATSRSTAQCGRILLELDAGSGLRWLQASRNAHRRPWHPQTQCPDPQTSYQKTSIIAGLVKSGD